MFPIWERGTTATMSGPSSKSKASSSIRQPPSAGYADTLADCSYLVVLVVVVVASSFGSS